MKKEVKKLTALAMMLMLLLGGLAGCGKEEAAAPAPAGTTPTEEAVYHVGICQLVQHAALDKATQGFMDALTDKLGDQVRFNLQNASGEVPVCATIANQFIAEDVDLILANATPALQACANATMTIPILGTSVTDFGTALDLEMNATGATGINVSGTNDMSPSDKQAAQILELFPDTEKVAIIYCSSEANSQYQSSLMEAELAALQVESQVFTFTDSNDIQAVSIAAAEYGDVIWAPTDNQVASNGAILGNIAFSEQVPVFASESDACLQVGGVATLSIDYYSIGYRAGEMGYEILVNGADPATMKVESSTKVTYLYLPEMAEMYGITIPDGYEALAAESVL